MSPSEWAPVNHSNAAFARKQCSEYSTRTGLFFANAAVRCTVWIVQVSRCHSTMAFRIRTAPWTGIASSVWSTSSVTMNFKRRERHRLGLLHWFHTGKRSNRRKADHLWRFDRWMVSKYGIRKAYSMKQPPETTLDIPPPHNTVSLPLQVTPMFIQELAR